MGTTTRSELVASAERAMKRRRFAEAIRLFDQHLERAPGDLEALLEVGICHLLNRSERTFVAIHRTARRVIAALREVPPRLARLWTRYDELFKKVSASALIMGSVALAGCGDEYSGHKYSGGVMKPPVAAPAARDEAKDDAKGDAKGDAKEDEEATRPDVIVQPPRPTFSAHRYSAGVYRPPRPAPRPSNEKQDDGR